MTESNPPAFIELTDFWLSITRRDHPAQGFGKWSLFTEEPHRLYRILEELMKSGALADAYSMKTRTEPREGVEKVYLYSAPYTDQEKLLRLAEELRELDGVHQFQLVRPLIFTTDLHNTWKEKLARPGDGYYELLHKNNWIYRYQGGLLVVNAPIQALHQALEEPPENADRAFLLIRSLLPGELFAGSGIPEDEMINNTPNRSIF
ncbi:MAG: hypothetical protein MUO54_02700 [Anaerolineales bacterium]|nr:hypothetical protein [Anaerolineales bacterium]